MDVFRHIKDIPSELRGCAVAIGNFDGVHLGHRAVIGEAGDFARAEGMPWAVLTFEPHPRMLFRAGEPPFRLTPFHAKLRRIQELGVDYVVALAFDRAFANQTPEWFVTEILVKGLEARHVFSGYDFNFGKGRHGDSSLLLRMGQESGYNFTCVNALKDQTGAPYSSTRIRHALRDGDPREAAALIGGPFEIEGRVVEGDARGRSIGFPTANIPLGDYLVPALGVYAVRAGIERPDGISWHDGVANLGRRPTFDGEGVVLETYLLDHSEDLYGKHLRVALLEFLRPETKFDGIEALKAQIQQDCALARDILAEERH
ncbi:MAG: bifunctional riboflavin kinase/FAD synthetase [Magnetospiraceae bacterium]